MKRLLPAVTLLAGLIAVPALAQPRPPPPRSQQRVVRADARRGPPPMREFRDARRDLAQLEQMLSRYDRSLRIRDLREVRRLDNQVLRLATVELRESQQDARFASHREARKERAKVRLVREVLQDYRRLEGRVDRRSLYRKRGMIVELIDLARRELRRG